MSRMKATAALITVGAIATTLLSSSPVSATGEETHRVEIVSKLDSVAASTLAPGQSVDWFLGVTSGPSNSGEVARELSVGVTAPHFTVTVDECESRRQDKGCAGPSELLATTSMSSITSVSLGDQPAGEMRWLRITVGLSPDAPSTAQNERGSLRFTATGDGMSSEAAFPSDTESPDAKDESDTLASTGDGVHLAELLMGVVLLITIGGVLLISRCNKEENNEIAS